MKVAIAGASGFVGKHIKRALIRRGDEVYEIAHKGTELIWDEALASVDAVINLSGRPIFTRWSQTHKKQILESRVQTAKAINHFYQETSLKPKVLISASAVGFYGDRKEETLVEESLKGHGFLSDVADCWEKATLDSPIKRIVIFRFGVILGKDGGAFKKLAEQVKWHLGAKLGSGKQWISWIHIEDVTGAILAALDQSQYKGIYNLVTEEPVMQERLIKELSKANSRKCFLKVPKCFLKWTLGEASSLLLDSQKAYPKQLKRTGYVFRYPDFESALYSLTRKSL